MEDKDTSDSPTDSQPEEEEQTALPSPGASPFSAKLRAMMRIRNKYQAMKMRRLEMGSALSVAGRPSLRSTSPEIFTFDGVVGNKNAPPNKKKKKRRSRVLFPNDSRKFLPTAERSRAKPCLMLLSIIVFLQVYNAIENLDDHVVKYDLEGLEKTLRREVFGQQEATGELLSHLNDYLSTYVHNKPLAVSLHGPTGVGKSHLGRILARHFHSVVGQQLVMQYYAMHHCPLEENAASCARDLVLQVTEVVSRAEMEEKIPVFILDEVEFMHGQLLDALHSLLQPNQTNEYLNAIYVLISSLGESEITKYVLQNSSSEVPLGRGGVRQLGQELGPLLRLFLEEQHSLWAEVDFVPLTLLEKSHVMDCFLDEMTREGFYPDRLHVEQLAGELSYYSAGGRQFSRNGCKQVVAKVNLL
ncbi:torsin family 4, member Ab [Megalops cyprinoides]|uniref:torsin family 4, member Ab n=1 Tax=Megalops cyprinoides TaxID=118141 RepID=UPI001863EE7F|nr:torsin family 4, member Ab [Megalops cyprinoides]